MRTLFKAFVFLMVLSASVLVHEYGHLVAMQTNGVQVERFTIGFGPTLWSYRRSDGVEFAIKPILLGGYTEPVAQGPHSMGRASRGVQFVIALAGTFVNVCVGFILLLALGYAGAVGPPKRLVARLEPVPDTARPFAAAAVMSFGAWLIAPFRIAVDYVRKLFGRPDRNKERQWDVKRSGGFSGELLSALTLAAAINVGLAEFNVLPFRPLDGGAATSLVIGAILGAGAQAWYDQWSFLILINLVLLSLFIGLFRGSPKRSDDSEPPSS